MNLKKVAGIWLPEADQHFVSMLASAPKHNKGATYQLNKYKAARQYVKHLGHAVDIGGHVGLWSRVMASDFAHVTAFEPLAVHRECFIRNTDGLENVELYPYALSNKAETLHIHMPHDNTGHAHVRDDGEECLAVTLDSMATLDKIDFLKIDVEGFELQVVQGAQDHLLSSRPVVIIEQKANNAEAQGAGRWDALNFLKGLGMRQVDVIAGDHILVW